MQVAERSPVEAAVAISKLAREHADATEAGRRLAAPVVDALRQAGLFRMLVPREIGGGEATVAELVAAIEAVARGDGSAGWCLMIAATTGITAALLPKEGAVEIHGNPDSITGGMLMPKGHATRVDGGYRVTGRWAYGSGSPHCTWLLGGSPVVGNDGRPELLDGNVPHLRMFFFPAGDYRIHDTWHVSGLRGTGSHDYEVVDAFVPEYRTVPIGAARPWAEGPLYRFPLYGLLALGVAAVGLGIARDAIDELLVLARGKTPTGSRRPLAERAAAQSGIAEAEALLGSARAFLFETVGHAWERAAAGDPLTIEDRARLRLAATNAALQCARAVDICYNLGGGTSIYETSRLQRHFRDIHTLTQHVMVGQPTYEVVGRIMLGLPTDTFML
ncbi:acyl-CoA dehydrogenase family protein [Tepidiforma sp.]|uniref:acyl-CoA dehydrogenase family protein n=1 Tax=Tepidiforma sp. TaxID=2682230 RepID=UPI002ADD5CFA|nr:acyl-CoA dehydrogenase family protein [Tepidiforma sp.]